jgi:predicted enzyme related to lactoylglutathione lyase
MIPVPDCEAGAAWYQRAFTPAVRVPAPGGGFCMLRYDGINLTIVPADEKLPAGAAGSVVYWGMPDFAAALAHMLAIGGRLYRGPLDIEDGQAMCQVLDPWGNSIGLMGVKKIDKETDGPPHWRVST